MDVLPLERQEPFVNQVLADHALASLTRLFSTAESKHHGAFANIRENRVQPIMIQATVWRRLRRRGLLIVPRTLHPARRKAGRQP